VSVRHRPQADVRAPLGRPRLHLRATTSTNDRARALAMAGAPHGTLVTAGEQSSGRGRQGRVWTAPPGRALLCSLVLRHSSPLISLAAGVAVAAIAGPEAAIKWPNDVLVAGRKVAGILVEGRPQEGWAVLGIGINVAVREADFPAELRGRAGSLGLEPGAVESVLAQLLEALERWLSADDGTVLDAVRGRDALAGARVRWAGGTGVGAGIDATGRLLVRVGNDVVALDAGEVHLASA
jgi:BirA family biotin operon repressor/biotin-[acetyl-CoA-carboxylase] ligase